MATSTINLLRPVSGGGAISSESIQQLRRIGWIAIILFLVVGIGGLILFLILRSSLASASRQEAVLTQQLQGLSTSEGLQSIVASRVAIVSRIFGLQENYDNIFSIIDRISPESGIVSIAYDQESDIVALKLAPLALDGASALVGRLIQMSKDREIFAATLNSLALGTDGMVSMSLSFQSGSP